VRKPKSFFLLLGLIVLGSWLSRGPANLSFSELESVSRLVAHRAILESDTVPNSRSALRAVFDYNPNAEAEIDVRQTNDGGFVLLHDADIQNETNGKGLVQERSSTELLRFVRKDGNGRMTREPVAFLEDALVLLREYPNARLQLDAKLEDQRSFVLLAKLISAHPHVRGRVTISSGNGDVLCRLSRQFPHLEFGLDIGSKMLSGPDLSDILRYIEACGVSSIYVDFNKLARMSDASARDVVGKFQEQGVAVAVWTVDDPLDALRVFWWGADKMTTNRIIEIGDYAAYVNSYVRH